MATAVKDLQLDPSRRVLVVELSSLRRVLFENPGRRWVRSRICSFVRDVLRARSLRSAIFIRGQATRTSTNHDLVAKEFRTAAAL